MASNHTENYGLNQWEPGDAVLRTDFNADNAKIDAAFLNHRSAELIASVTVEEEIPRLELDISQVDWSRYMALVLIADSEEYRGYSVSMANSERCVYMTASTQNTLTSYSFLYTSYAAHMSVLFPVFYDGRHAAMALALSFGEYTPSTTITSVTDLCVGGGQNSLATCKTIYLNRRSGLLAPGDRVVLWGVK